MPGAKRKNQNSPSGWKSKQLLVLPKVDASATKKKVGPKSAVVVKPMLQSKKGQTKSDQPPHNPGSMLSQKTYEDYNKQQPNPDDPNLKGSQNRGETKVKTKK